MAHSPVHPEFMSTTSDRPAARRAPDTTSYPVSRENGDVIPDTKQNPAVGEKESPFAKSWVHFVAGGVGGMTAATLTAPLDVLKTRLQSDFYQAQLRASHQARSQAVGSLSPFRAAIFHLRETFQILGSVYKIEGPRALFKGLGPNLVGVIPARSINFYTYGNGKRLIAEYGNGGNEAAWVHLSAGVLAGITTSTVTNPIWLVKTRLQLDKNVAQQKGGLHKRQGLYKGMSASYLGVAESTLQWVLYEQIKNRLAAREERIVASGREKTFWDQTVDWMGNAGAAGGAKLVAAILAYPHEVARTRLRQAPLANGQLKYTGLWQCFRVVWIEEGFMGLYGGLTPHLMRTVPSAAIMFGMYEGMLRIFGAPNKAAASL
ncbi:mitochondrial carrier protein RIM2 [Colletotrichum tofieldiae]|nr:mitochondrial carrier protein RIM2 [Colletotrichum tofieldiae]